MLSRLRPTSFFCICGLLFGLISTFILPPFQGPDEFNHFFRAYQVSEGQFWGEKTNDHRLGGYLPQSLQTLAQPFRNLPFQPQNTIKKDTLFNLYDVPLQTKNQIFIDFSNTAIYAPFAYMPAGLGIKVGHLFTERVLVLFYLARIFTLIFWLSTVYIAIKISPIQQWLWVALALLPTSIGLHATVNADVLCNAAAFVLISFFMKFTLTAVDAPISRRDALVFLTIATFLTVQKLAYLPIFLYFWVLPDSKFGSKKRKIIALTGFALVQIVAVGWVAVATRERLMTYEDYHPFFRIGQQLNEGADGFGQINYIFSHFFTYLYTLFYSLLKTAPHTVIHYLGKFGWEKNYLPWPLLAGLLGGLILRGASETHLLWRPIYRRAFLVCGSVAILSVATLMYLLWCPVGAPFIENLGGKYFIPVFPLFFLIIPYWPWAKKSHFIHLALLILSLCVYIFEVYNRYWDTF